VIVVNPTDRSIPYSLQIKGSAANRESLPKSITTLCFDGRDVPASD
jgi:hypothetical protein